MKLTLISSLIGALGTVTKGKVQGLKNLEIRAQEETIQTSALLKSARILKKSWKLKETCDPSDYSEKPSANTGVKNSQRSKILRLGTTG